MKNFIATELPRFMGFIIVGGGGFIVHAGLVYLLTQIGAVAPILAWFPAFLAAVCFTWLMNRLISFRGLQQHSAKQEAARYLTVQSLGAALNFLIYAGLIALALPYLSYPIVALACGSGAALFFNYAALRLFVFGQSKRPEDL